MLAIIPRNTVCVEKQEITFNEDITFLILFRQKRLAYTQLWKLRKFTLTLFWQKFRETNIFTKEITN